MNIIPNSYLRTNRLTTKVQVNRYPRDADESDMKPHGFLHIKAFLSRCIQMMTMHLLTIPQWCTRFISAVSHSELCERDLQSHCLCLWKRSLTECYPSSLEWREEHTISCLRKPQHSPLFCIAPQHNTLVYDAISERLFHLNKSTRL